MDEIIVRELQALERMVLNWKANYFSYATPDGNNEFLVEEFREEIDIYIAPYLRRLYQCEYLTKEEALEFLERCYDEVEALRLQIEELENPPVKPGLWRKIVESTKRVFHR